jgi:hypothetical protein
MKDKLLATLSDFDEDCHNFLYILFNICSSEYKYYELILQQ